MHPLMTRLNALITSKAQQKAIIDGVEKALTGVKQAHFKVAKTSNIEKLIAEFATEINEGISVLLS